MNFEAITDVLFDPVSQLDLIQLLFPQLAEEERELFLKLRAATLLLTRGVNAGLDGMDYYTRLEHERFIRDREARWVDYHRQIRDAGMLDRFSRAQKLVFHNDFSKVRFTAQ